MFSAHGHIVLAHCSMASDNLEYNDLFFNEILRRSLQDGIIDDVIVLKREPVTQKGENFLSELTRFTLKYVCNVIRENRYERIERVTHLILKEELKVSSEISQSICDVFTTERSILEQIVPKIEAAIGRRLGPKVLFSSSKPQVIVMEDLTVPGFKITNRKLGLNFDQTMMVLENLADFHAGSVLLFEQNFKWLKDFARRPAYATIPVAFCKMIEDTLSSVGKRIRGWSDGPFLLISEKLQRLSQETAGRWEDISKYDADELCVLNHGDLWANNIMFKNDDDGILQQLRFIDYQLCTWTSPALDLCHFLASAPELTLKGTKDDIFLEQYLNRLSTTMLKIGCRSKSPTPEQLRKSMHKRRMMSLISGIVYFPKMVAEEDDLENIEDILQKQKCDIDVMKNLRVKSTLKKILPIWDERGYLD